MNKLTAQQATQIADQLHEIAYAFAGYVISNQKTLAPEQKKQLVNNQLKILKIADDLLDYASDLVFDDIDQQLGALSEVNAVIRQKLKTLTDLQKIIEVSTAALLLAEAIISADPKGIAHAAGDIFKAMKPKPLL